MAAVAAAFTAGVAAGSWGERGPVPAASGVVAPGAGEVGVGAGGAAAEIPGDGTFSVGPEVAPGTYRTAGPVADGAACHWERLRDLGGSFSSILASETLREPGRVTILDGDRAFRSTGCQPWVKVG